MTGLHWTPLHEGVGVVVGPDGSALAHYDWRTANHPYFDQMRPLSHGGVLTNHAPHDHRWHHGLWWSWKFVNDVLFWEDHADYGGNRLGLGRSVVTDHEVKQTDGTVVIREQLAWRVDATGEDLLIESRQVAMSVDPETDDRWYLDWDQTWIATSPVRLDSTPWPETSWGGYGGLNYRPARSMAAGELLRGDGLSGASALHGTRSPWAAYTGLLDGAGTDDPGHPAEGGMAFLQHPANSRYPAPIYAFSATDGFGFLATAPVMHDPLDLDAGESHRIRTRVIVLDSSIDGDALIVAYDRYCGAEEVRLA